MIKFDIIGVLIKCMVKDALPGLMVETMKEIMNKIKNMDMENFNGLFTNKNKKKNFYNFRADKRIYKGYWQNGK